MKIAISAESTIDLPKELLEKYSISTVPFTITLGDVTEKDGEITNDRIIEYVNKYKVLPKTSAVNREQFTEHFGKLLRDYDAVIHFSLSKEMSSAYDNAVNAAKALKNVYVIDTRSLSTGIALLAIDARKLDDTGLSAKEIYERCLARVPYVQASFELKRIDYLYKGGRCIKFELLGQQTWLFYHFR